MARPVNNAPFTPKTNALKRRFQRSAFLYIRKANAAAEANKASDAKAYMVSAGISTEKMLLLDGRPTGIIENVHSVNLSQLREALVAAVLQTGKNPKLIVPDAKTILREEYRDYRTSPLALHEASDEESDN